MIQNMFSEKVRAIYFDYERFFRDNRDHYESTFASAMNLFNSQHQKLPPIKRNSFRKRLLLNSIDWDTIIKEQERTFAWRRDK
ncbi:MAG: hypothetical protein K0Q56_2074 [Sporolactobacillus laevolacticus]|jgi:hypothetical protein|nr:hypothetical protein [Sporolactobacillus laevolacticus]